MALSPGLSLPIYSSGNTWAAPYATPDIAYENGKRPGMFSDPYIPSEVLDDPKLEPVVDAFKEVNSSRNAVNASENGSAPWFQPILDAFADLKSTNEAANALSQTNAKAAMDFERRETDRAREWYKQMEDTYVQRRLADVEKAGLNRWMALYGNLGNTGASMTVPSGSVAKTFKSSGSLDEYALPLLFASIQAISGLVSSALGGKSIFDSVGDGFSNIVDFFADLVNKKIYK